MENERSASLTVLLLLYTITTVYVAYVLVQHAILTSNGFMFSLIRGLASLGTDIVLGALIVMNLVYVVKLWSADASLKRWTDIMLMAGAFVSVFVFLTFAIPPVMKGHVLAVGLQGYAIYAGVLVSALVIAFVVWVFVTRHLSRLEREGRASFDPGLFNRHA